MDSAVEELRALGETPGKRADGSPPLTLKEELAGVVRDVGDLRTRFEPAFRSLAQFLANASSLQSFGFELARQKRTSEARLNVLDEAVESIRIQIEASNELGEQVSVLERKCQLLQGLAADTQAAALANAELVKGLAEISNWRSQAEARLTRADLLTENVAALDEKFSRNLANQLDELTSWKGTVESRFNNVEALPRSIGALDDKLTALIQALEERSGRRRRDTKAEMAVAREELAKLTGKFEQFVATPSAIGAQDLVETICQPDVMDPLLQELSNHFVKTEAMGIHSSRISLLGREIAVVREAAGAVDPGLAAQLAELRGGFEEATLRARRAEDALAQSGQLQSYLVNRIEFVRREMMFEFRHGRSGEAPAQLEVETSIMNAPKVEAQRTAPHINLGCGHIPIERYLNVDRRKLPGVDIVAEAGNLPFGPGEVAEIRSAHLLEHFPQEELRRSLLPYWRSLLKAGGRFVAIVPDAAEMIAASARGEYDFERFREVFFGAQDYVGDYHYNMFTPESLLSLLQEAGFVKLEIIARGRRNGACFEFEISAAAPRK